MSDQYTRLYGEDASNLLIKHELLVVSSLKAYVGDNSRYIASDPIPVPVPGPGQELKPTPWGNVIVDQTVGQMKVSDFITLMKQLLGKD